MRKRIVHILSCPNTKVGSFKVFAHMLRRKNETINDVEDTDINDEDDILNGILINEESHTVYPISDSIAMLLSDQDVNTAHYVRLLESVKPFCPVKYRKAIESNIHRVKMREITDFGEWNREEMEYFDENVGSEELRKKMRMDVKTTPFWNSFIPRSRHIIQYIRSTCRGNTVLEIGCGNARTIYWIFQPARYNYNYIGTDISWKRLILAKSVLPDGDFIQASALNLPFRDGSFSAILSFGVLHHLPDPSVGIRECLSKLSINGYLGLDEPIEKPAQLLPEGRFNFIQKIISTYEHSVHDNQINMSKTIELLRRLNLSIENISYSHSIFRTFASFFVLKLPESCFKKNIWKLIIFVDQMFLRIFCHIPNRFGPGAVLLVVKNSNI